MFLCKIFFTLFVIQCSALSFELQLNDACTSTWGNTAGSCVEPSNCRDFRQNMKKVNICSFNKTMPIVCCPNSNIIKKFVEKINVSSEFKCEV